jgi:hypothetical protein
VFSIPSLLLQLHEPLNDCEHIGAVKPHGEIFSGLRALRRVRVVVAFITVLNKAQSLGMFYFSTLPKNL